MTLSDQPKRLLSVSEVATLLAVSGTTVRNWIKSDAIPYVELPGRGVRSRYRVPLQGLLAALPGTYDLGADLKALEQLASDDTQAKETNDG